MLSVINLLSQPGRRRPRPERGFTMIELAVVMVIIGLLMSLILKASMASVRRAEERATQALISKLETGLDDRLQALLETQPPYNNAHAYMAAIYNAAYAVPANPTGFIEGKQRAVVIAQFDQIKAEIPDVFYVQSNNDYPLNFAAQPFNSGTPGTNFGLGKAIPYWNYQLPLGNGAIDDGPLSGLAPPGWTSFGAAPANAAVPSAGTFNPYGTGMFGASYTAAGGIYKNLGYAPTGYDGADNNNDGMIDNYPEGIAGLNPSQVTQIATNLSNHKHKTARSEMLYALLVEGQGPLGSIFSADDFTAREIQDTDNDGLPEFVDAWGEPLQFFRWPIYYHSDHQRGVPANNSYNGMVQDITKGPVSGVAYPFPNNTPQNPDVLNYPYASVYEAREQNPLDPNQQLLSPSWWSNSSNTGTAASGTYLVQTFPTALNAAPLSPGAALFSTFFHTLLEPLASPKLTGAPNTQWFWDRGSNASPPYYPRRAYFSKFLIISSGPDHEHGVARLDAFNIPLNPTNLLVESQARQTNIIDYSTSASDPFLAPTDANPVNQNTGTPLYDAGQDDVSNHNFQAPGGVVQ
jgi:prepilin-type N-terminal cleavage/methylation domain-containing protein